jgi:DNA-binding transcriptional MocR family regulator
MNEETRADAGNYLRLSFSHVSEHELERGIAALGQAIRACIS